MPDQEASSIRSPLSTRKRQAVLWTAALACALAAGITTYVADGRIPVLDDVLLDVATVVRARLMPPSPADGEHGAGTSYDEDVAVVVLDERSLESEQLRNRPRALLAPEFGQLVAGLVEAGARVVAFDIIFQYSGNRISAGYDRPFQQALFRHRGRVVLGRGQGQRQVPARPLLAALGGTPGALGLLVLQPDPDGVIREIALQPTTLAGASVPTLAGAALTLAGVPDLPESVRLGRKRHLESLPTYSFVDVWRCAGAADGPAQLRTVFDGRIVFVGTSLPTEDRVKSATRFLPRPSTAPGPAATGCGLRPVIASASDVQTVPGVFLHAAATQAVLSGATLSRVSPAMVAMLAGAAALAGIALARRLRRLWGLGWVIVLSAALLGLSVILLESGIWLPPLPAIVSAVGAMLVGYLMLYVLEGRRRRYIQTAFGRYLAPAVVEQLLEDPSRLKLGGERRETTFLFTDVAGFTSLTERTEPSDLVRLLNDYLDETCAIVLRNGGTIDKIVGDALHVMFNAPSDQPDHAERAVSCAIELDNFCHGFAKAQRESGTDFRETRIGVNSGYTVVGNFGGASRFDYTAHGDAINTAARLESVNRHLGTRVCVSESTMRLCHGIEFRPVGLLVLKGKSEGIRVYEPVSEDSADSAALEAYHAAYGLLESQDPGATEAFVRLSEEYPHDGLVAFHLARLRAGDTGVRIVMTSK